MTIIWPFPLSDLMNRQFGCKHLCSETYSDPFKRLGWSNFIKIVNGFWLLVVFTKRSVLDTRWVSDYAPLVIHEISNSDILL